MKVVRDETTLQMLTVGFGKSIKKFDILSIEEKQRMLAQMICQPTSPCSLNLRFGYFGMLNFFIKECFELPYVDFDEFSLVSLFINVVLRFCLGVSKNWWIDIACCFLDWFRPDVDYLVVDVIINFKKIT